MGPWGLSLPGWLSSGPPPCSHSSGPIPGYVSQPEGQPLHTNRLVLSSWRKRPVLQRWSGQHGATAFSHLLDVQFSIRRDKPCSGTNFPVNQVRLYQTMWTPLILSNLQPKLPYLRGARGHHWDFLAFSKSFRLDQTILGHHLIPKVMPAWPTPLYYSQECTPNASLKILSLVWKQSHWALGLAHSHSGRCRAQPDMH